MKSKVIGIVALLLLTLVAVYAIQSKQKISDEETSKGSVEEEHVMEENNSSSESNSTNVESVSSGSLGNFPSQGSGSSAITGDAGRLVVAITDDVVSFGEIDSLYITISDIAAYSSKGWQSIGEGLRTYDLVRLKQEGSLELVFDIPFKEASYNQIRFTISGVSVVKDGVSDTAYLPSSIVYIPASFTIKKGQISSLVLDFIGDKSLHRTETGRYIFAPVVDVFGTGGIDNVQKSGFSIEFLGGVQNFSSRFGMNESGRMIKNSDGLDSLSHIEFSGNILVLIPHSIDRSKLIINPSQAMTSALARAYISRVLSIRVDIFEEEPTWIVQGSIGGKIVYVYVNAESGNISKVER